jgi:bifunctional non-homologous end joining protein LigD
VKRRHGRRSLDTSNEDKVLFPGAGITKGDLIDYYERISDRMLPHLKDRPLVMQRFPDGIEKSGFYQKQVGDYFPDWIDTVRVKLKTSGESQELVVCGNKTSLAYLMNQACLTLHPWLSRRDRVDHPDLMVIDLDPPGSDFEPARTAALRVRDLFEELDLACFAKLTGSKGVHVVVPLDRRSDFDAVRAFARAAMKLLASRYPDELTTAPSKSKRRGRLYLDTGRNAYAQTAVAPWSPRPLPGAPVAAPVAWRDLERKGIGARDYTVRNVFRRIARRQDPWARLRRRARSLGAARRRLDRLREDDGS